MASAGKKVDDWEFSIGDIVVEIGHLSTNVVVNQWFGEYMLSLGYEGGLHGENKSYVERNYVKVGHV